MTIEDITTLLSIWLGGACLWLTIVGIMGDEFSRRALLGSFIWPLTAAHALGAVIHVIIQFFIDKNEAR